MQKTSSIRYEPNESPRLPLTIGLAFQTALIGIGGIVVTPMIVIQASGLGEPYLSWGVFGALAISGVTTLLQSFRLFGIGSGYTLMMGTSGAFIACSISALKIGGASLLAFLVFASSFVQFIFSYKLSMFRKIITPTVAGTIIMLISVSVMPIVFNLLGQTKEGVPVSGNICSALATVGVMVFLILRNSKGMWRLWAVALGILSGCIVSSFFGLYETSSIGEAAWIGIPSSSGWPGLNIEFSSETFSLLFSFLFITVIGAIETIGDGVAIQRVSWRKNKTVDFRAVQGAVNADAVGNLLSGFMGTVPNTTYSSSISIVEITGVASRKVGMWIGVIFLFVSFSPKVLAILLAIPTSVGAAYLFILLGSLFSLGLKIVVQDGMDTKKAIIVGASFWFGVGFQNKQIFFESLGEFWGPFLADGMTSGGLMAIVLTFIMRFTTRRKASVKVDLKVGSLTQIKDFLGKFIEKSNWDKASLKRIEAVGEEALITLSKEEDDSRQLLITAEWDNDVAKLEFMAALKERKNLEDQMALISEQDNEFQEREISLRLLRHLSSSVKHQQYQDMDIITIYVDPV